MTLSHSTASEKVLFICRDVALVQNSKKNNLTTTVGGDGETRPAMAIKICADIGNTRDDGSFVLKKSNKNGISFFTARRTTSSRHLTGLTIM